ncbi:STAS domain-containing protein [Succinivibrio dextrinosolvens]|jgi:anti-anti-sigma factor|uniref:STAS domain-containing protein n=1 Tax=Succinivibrio dextrinosolvens TaxID=83771 RepID=UPI0019228221|nr:STAS domain-containing protein [Succinivibrio dextrinosolvens]
MEIHLNDNSMSGTEIISINGRLDALSSSALEEKIDPLTHNDSTSSLIFDLAGLEYISSAGLRVLLKTAKTCKNTSKKMILCGLTKTVSDVFKISGFDLILDIKPDLNSVKEALGN